METPRIDPRKLLDSVKINWWIRYADVGNYLHRLLVKCGEPSNPVLFEILLEKEKYDFALRCLKEIGITNEELSKLFLKAPMTQVYDFFYGERKKNPRGLNQMWNEKKKLGVEVPGKPTMLEHLLLNLFTQFNFVVMHVDSSGARGVDIVCFYPESLDLFIIGCTTGTLKNDLANIDGLMKEMKEKNKELFDRCSITPIVACTDTASVSPSDAEYAVQNQTVIIKRQHIDTLLEMLSTRRQGREVVKYIKSLRELSSSGPII